jgi:hypothetical protein
MADPTSADDTSAPVAPRCPWCSAALPEASARSCPSCHANLVGENDAQVPGVNAIDLEKLAFRRSVTPKRSRLLSWISGDLDYEDATDPIPQPGSLAPPPLEVRREMIRLEMAALIADLTAEAGALASEEAVAQGTDPAAAAAAIQAELDAATKAEALTGTGEPAPAASANEPAATAAAPADGTPDPTDATSAPAAATAAPAPRRSRRKATPSA